VSSIQEIGAQVRELNEVATVIAGATEEQGTVSQEIARNVAEAATGTGEVSKNVMGVKEASDLTDDEAEHVLQFAQELAQQSEQLRDQVDKLLTTMRAA
jgi:methyl-accepting chemotaxis protein